MYPFRSRAERILSLVPRPGIGSDDELDDDPQLNDDPEQQDELENDSILNNWDDQKEKMLEAEILRLFQDVIPSDEDEGIMDNT